MVDDPRHGIDVLREKLRNGDRDVHCQDCRDALLQYSENVELIPSEVGDYRHRTVLKKGTRMAEHAGCLARALEDREEAEQIVRWIHATYDDSEYTNQTYRSVLRSFGKHATSGPEEPDSLAWISYSTSNNHDPTPSERDLLTHDEMLELVDACRNPRDKALIAVQFEAGCRPYELEALEVGDVFESEYATGIHVDGKQGERAVHLITSTPYLQAWLNEHPSGDPSDPLWCKLDTAGAPSYNTFLGYFKTAASRAGIDKSVTPRNFRKSNTRWLVLQGFEQSRIEDRQGRTRGSDHTKNYMARFGSESNERAYARIHGKDVDEADGAADVGPVECPRCHRETPRTEDYCMWCHAALSLDAAEQVDELEDATAASIADAADASVEDLDPEDILELRSEVQDNPALRKLLASLL